MKKEILILCLVFIYLNVFPIEYIRDHILDFGITGNYQDFDGFVDFPYLYTFSTYAFEIYSINEENGELMKISSLPIPGEINSIQNIDNYCYISTTNEDFDLISTLYKIDVSNSQQPQIIALINRDYGIWSLRNYNNHLVFHKLVNGYVNSIVFLDPETIEEINTVYINRFTYAINDTIIAYVEGEPNNTAILYNISNINNIEYICSIDLSASSLGVGFIHSIGNNMLVMAPNTGVSFWDISDVTDWQLLSDYNTLTPGTKWGGVNKIDDYLLVPQQNTGIEVIDISDLSNPAFISFWEFPIFFCFNLNFSFSKILNYNNDLYIGTFQDGIFHLNIENGYIDFQNRILTDAVRYTNSIIHEDYLMTTSYNYGSQIYNISDIQNPYKTTTLLDSCYTMEQQIFDNYLIISHYDRDELEHISLFDISYIDTPILLYEFIPSLELDFFINPMEDNVIYIQTGYPQYQIEKFDISTPNNPQLLMNFFLPEAVGTGFFYDSFVYFQAPTGSNDLYIYSNFANNQPILENSINNFGLNNFSNLSLIDSYLQLINPSFNNRYYELSDPANPSFAFSLDSSSCYWKMEIDNNILFSSKNYSLDLYDLSNNPTGQIQPFDSILLNSRYRDLNFIEDENTNYMLATQLECISVYEYEVIFSGVSENTISSLPYLSNHPNPFNPSTEISFQISDYKDIESAEIAIYNIKGQKVKTFLINPSTLQPINFITWNGEDENNQPISSGVYFYQLEVNGKTAASKKCLLLK